MGKVDVLKKTMCVVLSGVLAVGLAPLLSDAVSRTQGSDNANAAYANTIVTATPMQLGKAYSATVKEDAYEYYSFRTTNRNSEYVLKGAVTDSDNALSAKFRYYDASYEQIGIPKYFSGVINHTYQADRNSTCYISLTPLMPGLLAAGSISCTFQIVEKPIAPKAVVLKSFRNNGKKKATVKWYGLPSYSASYYQVKLKKKGSSWKTYTVTSSSKAFSKLKKGKTYSVKVRAVNKAQTNGSKAYGPWSGTKTIKIKK